MDEKKHEDLLRWASNEVRPRTAVWVGSATASGLGPDDVLTSNEELLTVHRPEPASDPINETLSRINDQIKGHREAIDALKRYSRELSSPRPSLALIEAEANLEIRRILIDRYGFEEYMRDIGAEVIATDEYGELLQKPNRSRFEVPMVAVRVKNSSPEPDGTFKYYMLRVPPDTQSPRAGIAWTFGLTEKEYNPAVMT